MYALASEAATSPTRQNAPWFWYWPQSPPTYNTTPEAL